MRAGTLTPGRLALAGLFVALAVWVFVYKAAPEMPDFEVWSKAASRAAQAEPLYRASDGHFVFKYLPAFAVLAIPIGLLPLVIGKGVWFFASLALLVALVSMAVRLPVERRRTLRWLVIVTVVSFLKFYAHELVLGQVNILFAVVATGALLAMKAKREVLAGVLIVLATVIKPYAVLFVPWLIARRQLPSIASACAGLAARPRPAGGALRVGRQRLASSRVVANGDRDHCAQSVELRQRIARWQCSSAGWDRASCRRAWRTAVA